MQPNYLRHGEYKIKCRSKKRTEIPTCCTCTLDKNKSADGLHAVKILHRYLRPPEIGALCGRTGGTPVRPALSCSNVRQQVNLLLNSCRESSYTADWFLCY